MNGLTILGLIGMWLIYRLVTTNNRLSAILDTLTPDYELCGACNRPIDPYTGECRCSA